MISISLKGNTNPYLLHRQGSNLGKILQDLNLKMLTGSELFLQDQNQKEKKTYYYSYFEQAWWHIREYFISFVFMGTKYLSLLNRIEKVLDF